MVVERGPSPADAQANRVKVLWPPAEEAFLEWRDNGTPGDSEEGSEEAEDRRIM